MQASVSGYTNANSKWTKTSDATLYAGWNSSTGSYSSVTLPTITLTGHTCKWQDKNSTSTYYNSGASLTPSASIELQGVCTADSYTITLDKNGATNTPTGSTTVTYGATSLGALATLPTKSNTTNTRTVSGFGLGSSASGASVSSTSTLNSTATTSYTFNGWHESSGTGALVASSAATPALQASVSGYTNSSSQWTRTSGATLYAGWNSSTGAYSSVTLPTITKTGNTCHWNTNSSDTGTSYNSGASITPSGNLKLTGFCSTNTYAITFTFDSHITNIVIKDSAGTSTVATISTSGGTANLTYGTTYKIVPTFASNYELNSMTKTTGSGTLSGDSFTVGAGTATITTTSVALPEMQSLTSAQCTTAGTKVYDNRDGSTYLVKRLADGNCWMLDNLRLDPTTVSLATLQGNTNASNTTLSYLKNGGGSSPYPASGVSSAWTSSSQNLPYINATSKDTTTTSYGSGSGKVGVYYNYCAASAGSYCYTMSSSSGDATEDLCPAGWRMPTGGSSDEYQALYTAYSSDATDFKNALSTPLSGYFYSGSVQAQGTAGYFWSSTRSSNYAMRILRVDADYVRPTYTHNRFYGVPMRCILDS